MKERERPVIEHILTLIKFFQNKQAEAGEQNSLPVPGSEEIQTARERMDLMEEKARLLQEKEQSEEKWIHLKEEYDQERALANQEQNRRLDVIKGLGISHESIFYLDLDEDKILPYRHSDRTESVFSTLHHAWDYGKWISQYIQDWVHPEDRERMKRETASGAIRRRLEDSASFALNYRVVDQEETQYLQFRFDSVGEKDRPAQIVMGCRRVDEELRRELEQKQPPEEPAAPPAEEEVPEETPVRCRILLVEDNALNREIETEILKSLDFPVETAGNGREAVETLQAAGPEHFGLILMDIQMPVMNGWEATKAIRALPDPALSRIPIVALSANVFESDVQKSLELGMNAHLAKPVDVPELLGTIEKIMRMGK